MTRLGSAGLLTLVGFLSLGGVSCGGDSGNPAAPTPSTNTQAPRVISQGSLQLQAPTTDSVFFNVVPITDGSAGTWEATVDWTLATNALFMYVANGSCTVAQFAADDCPDLPTCACQFAVRSEVATPKPRVLTLTNPAGTPRTLIVINLGPAAETASYTVRLTPNSTTSVVDGAAGDRGIGVPRVDAGRKVIR